MQREVDAPPWLARCSSTASTLLGESVESVELDEEASGERGAADAPRTSKTVAGGQGLDPNSVRSGRRSVGLNERL